VIVLEQMADSGVVFVRKSDSWLMRLVGRLVGAWFMVGFVTTLRLPFLACRVYYPSGYPGPRAIPDWLLRHERHHVWQFAPWYGPMLMAWRYATPGGRWLVERRAMLVDVRARRRTYTEVALLFRRMYRWPYPESWMPEVGEMTHWMATHFNDPEQPW